eukprot:gene790-biopygen9294
MVEWWNGILFLQYIQWCFPVGISRQTLREAEAEGSTYGGGGLEGEQVRVAYQPTATTIRRLCVRVVLLAHPSLPASFFTDILGKFHKTSTSGSSI